MGAGKITLHSCHRIRNFTNLGISKDDGKMSSRWRSTHQPRQPATGRGQPGPGSLLCLQLQWRQSRRALWRKLFFFAREGLVLDKAR